MAKTEKNATATKDGLERGAKSKAIREYKQANPEAKTKDIAAAVSQQLGTQVTEGLVAQVVKGPSAKRKEKELSADDVLGYFSEIKELGSFDEIKSSLERVQKLLTLTDGNVSKAMQLVEKLEKYKEVLEPFLTKKEQAA